MLEFDIPFEETGIPEMFRAMLIDAVVCALAYSSLPSWWHKLSALERRLSEHRSVELAVAWMNSSSEDTFSFNNVCETLGVDPSYIRSRVGKKIGFKFKHQPGNRLPISIRRGKPAKANEDFDWNSMYQLGMCLYMAGYREKSVY